MSVSEPSITMPSLAERLQGKVRNLSTTPEASPYLNTVIYGPPGVGKTSLGSTWPNVLIGNADKGDISIWGEDVEDFSISTFDDVSDLAEWMMEHHPLRDKLRYLMANGGSAKQLNHTKDAIWALNHTEDIPRNGIDPRLFDSIVFDSLTETQKKSLDDILIGEKRLEKHDPDKANLDDYGKNTQQMRKLVRFFRDLPYNTCFICHDVDDKEDTGEAIVRPFLTPKLATEVMGWVDVVGYLYTKAEGQEIVRKLLVQPWKKYKAKLRRPKGVVLPPVIAIDNPDFNKIYQAVFGKDFSK